MNRLELNKCSIPRALLGYNRLQVDRLMQDLSDALARMTEEKITLSVKNRELENALSTVKQQEKALQESLTTSKRIGDDIREAAQKEAQLILETARLKADGLLQNANIRLARVMEEAAEAKRNKVLFEVRLKTLIEDHLRLLEMNRQKSASLETAAQKLAGTTQVDMPATESRDT